MNGLKVRLAVLLAMVAMLLAVASPAMAQDLRELGPLTEQAYSDSIAACSAAVVQAIVEPEEFEECVEETFMVNVQGLLQNYGVFG